MIKTYFEKSFERCLALWGLNHKKIKNNTISFSPLALPDLSEGQLGQSVQRQGIIQWLLHFPKWHGCDARSTKLVSSCQSKVNKLPGTLVSVWRWGHVGAGQIDVKDIVKMEFYYMKCFTSEHQETILFYFFVNLWLYVFFWVFGELNENYCVENCLQMLWRHVCVGFSYNTCIIEFH